MIGRREKTAEFLADCLSHMPPQRGVVNTVIAGLELIANGGEWPEEEAIAAIAAAKVSWASFRAVIHAANWAALEADAAWSEWATKAADCAADWAARAHPDPTKERARQAQKRKELGL